VLISAFAILALAALGLETLCEHAFQWRWWMWLPFGLLAGLSAWCAYRTGHLPEPLATQIESSILGGNAVRWVHDLAGVRRAQAWFIRSYGAAAVWCGLGALGWIILRSGRVRLLPVLGPLLLGDLLWFAYGRNVQCDPALYYPPVPALEALAKAPPGRIMGNGCLPATLAAICGLHDIRGYDAVDPARMTELILSAADPASPRARYAATIVLAPKMTLTPAGQMRLPPVLDMLGVRYVIFRGTPGTNTQPIFQGQDYWVLENPAVLPRAFVPHRVEVVNDAATRLEKLSAPEFDPREIAYVESPVSVPDSCRGAVEVVGALPTRVRLSVRMETAGLVVLADTWDRGWHAYLDGRPQPILRANHAIRGVVVPAGTATLEFRYQPASLAWGLALAALAAISLAVWLAVVVWRDARAAP
jgi:hypothetical protein